MNRPLVPDNMLPYWLIFWSATYAIVVMLHLTGPIDAGLKSMSIVCAGFAAARLLLKRRT